MSSGFRYAGIVCAAPLLACGTPALAADSLFSNVRAADWVLTVGVNVFFEPDYPGSDDLQLSGAPVFGLRRVGEPERFKAMDEGFGVALFEAGRFRAGPVGKIVSSRDEDTNDAMLGLDDVDTAFEVGGFAEYWVFDNLRARVEARHGFFGHHGLVADVFVDWVQQFGAYTLSAGPRLALGDDEFTDTYFGVGDDEASRSRLSAYDASGGITSVGAAGAVKYAWNENWATTLYGRYDRLVGDAADSPIVRDVGSADQFKIGTTVSYSFRLGR